MEKFKIEYQGWHSSKAESGLDYVYFDALVHSLGENKISFPVFLPYNMIEKQVEETIDGGPAILKQIKKRTRGWGPKESLYIKELEECGIDLARIFIKYLENNYNLEADYIKWSKNDVVSADLNKIVDDMGECLVDIKSETEQYFLICERLEKIISDEMMAMFPQLLNSSSSYILKFEEILVKHVANLAGDLNNLVFEADNNLDGK